MKRDYVPQMLEIQRAVLAQAETTKTMWQDDVAKRYYGDYVDCYEKDIDAYLKGGSEIRGKGLEELLEFFEQKMAEMEELTGCSNPNGGFGMGNGMADGDFVLDVHLNRPNNMFGDHGVFSPSVPNPDHLDTETVHSIEEERTDNDDRGRMESPYSSFGR